MHTTEKCRTFLFRIIFQWTKELDESRLSLHNNTYTEHTKILCMLLLICSFKMTQPEFVCVALIKREFLSIFFSMAIVRVFFFVHSLLAYFSNVYSIDRSHFRWIKIRWRCSAYALIFLLYVLIPWVMDTFLLRMFFISFKNNILFINGHVTQARRLTPKIMPSPCIECSVFFVNEFEVFDVIFEIIFIKEWKNIHFLREINISLERSALDVKKFGRPWTTKFILFFIWNPWIYWGHCL